MGAQRCPAATDRTGIATEATCRWSWSSMAGYAGGAQWNLVGFGHGAQGRELPKKYPPYRTCHRRFQQWVREDKLERILRVLAAELRTRGKLEVEEAFIDASFTGAKKGASRSSLPSAARGRKSSLADDHRLPLAISIESASPHESQLVEGVLGQTFLDTLPAGLIGDKACDGDRWDRDLASAMASR
jgi:hypothetical protein